MSDDMTSRERVVATCDAGQLKRVEIAKQFGVSTSWIRGLLQRRRSTGEQASAAGTRPDRKPSLMNSYRG